MIYVLPVPFDCKRLLQAEIQALLTGELKA